MAIPPCPDPCPVQAPKKNPSIPAWYVFFLKKFRNVSVVGSIGGGFPIIGPLSMKFKQ
jgi:hypothetical protein